MDSHDAKRHVHLVIGIVALCLAASDLVSGPPGFLQSGRWGSIHELFNTIGGTYGMTALKAFIGVAALLSMPKKATDKEPQ